jgi:hypothetical protein
LVTVHLAKVTRAAPDACCRPHGDVEVRVSTGIAGNVDSAAAVLQTGLKNGAEPTKMLCADGLKRQCTAGELSNRSTALKNSWNVCL